MYAVNWVNIIYNKKQAMRCSRSTQLNHSTLDNLRKCENHIDNVQPPYLSAIDLDKVMAEIA